MNLIVIDTEMNQPSGSIIEVGGVVFDNVNQSLVAFFNILVNPNEPISEDITKLTSITSEMVASAYNINYAATFVEQLKQQHSVNAVGITWGAGHTNDIALIYKQALMENPFRARIIDVKAVYQMYANASGGKMRGKVGLKQALDNLKLGWDYEYGNPHNALSDAYNTMRMYIFLSKCLKVAVDLKMWDNKVEGIEHAIK